MMKTKLYSIFGICTCMLLSACVGKKLSKEPPSEVLVPDELAKSFEIKDYDPNIKKNPQQLLEEDKSISKLEKNKKLKSAALKDGKNVKKENEKAQSTSADIKNGPFQSRRPKVEPIWVGERIFMDVSWLKTRAGEFELTVQPYKELNDRKVYHFKGFARTADFFAWFYKADDYVESFVDYEYWIPYKFALKGDESKYQRNYLELYDHAQKKQYVHTVNFKVKTGETAEDKGYKDLTPLTQDAISSLYYVRTLELNEGSSYQFPMTTNGRQVEAEIKVIGREELNTKAGTFKAIKTQVFTKLNGMLQQKGDSFIWFSDDLHKYPLKFEAKVKIGWVTGLVKQIIAGTASEHSSNADLQKFSRNVANSDLETKSKTKNSKSWFEPLVEKEESR